MGNPNSYLYFSNRECEYFPCHKMEGDYFNCLFCYCPLYMLGEDCGGNFTYTKAGGKDCGACLIPHSKGGYEIVTERFKDIEEKMAQDRQRKAADEPRDSIETPAV